MKVVDINCDVGEGINNEELLLPYISSCNIACGGHAGDIETIDRILILADLHEVKVGAHPSFPDKVNFGRTNMDISKEDLEASLISQIQLLQHRLELIGGNKLHHIKMHGALYNLSAVDIRTAQVIINALLKIAPDTTLYVPHKSVLATIAVANAIKIKTEAFADRNYNDDLTLVARSEPNAVISEKDAVVKHLIGMIMNQEVRTISGRIKAIAAETYCVHGDNPKAIALVKHIHTTLTAQGITIA